MMSLKIRMATAFVAMAILTACSSLDVNEYADRGPILDPKTFFEGQLCADGVVRSRSGEQIRQFQARILASWDEHGVGTLDEIFEFDDGVETRIWTLIPEQDGVYRASASDVPKATQLRYAGNAIHMNYVLRYGEPGDTIDLTMDDWMFLVSPGVVVNETVMSKWGIRVGQVLLVIRQVADDETCISQAAIAQASQ
ncbi:MAG: DUF3833 domain-containing protein [Bacterioplanes sp.]|nr:DUF3833 domain-containing protein [Bacterioplanes sp.]